MKKFKLLAITMLASTLALSSCMLLPKKKTSSSSDSTSQPDDPTGEGWSSTVQNEMKQYLDGEVLPFVEGTWEWEYDEEYEEYTGTSADAVYSKVVAAFKDWKVEETSYYGMFDYHVALKNHSGGPVLATLMDLSDYEDGAITISAYFTQEQTAWTSAETSEMVSTLGEAFPFPGGQWSSLGVDSGTDEETGETYQSYFIQSSHSYNETAIKAVLTNAGYGFTTIPETEDYDEYEAFEKQTSKGYIQGYMSGSIFSELGYIDFYLSDTSILVDETFELTANAKNYLKGDSGTLTLTVGADVPAGTTAYAVSPASAATVTPTSTGASFVISDSLTEDTTITFTATRGDFEATCTIKAYVSEIPVDVSVYKLDCTVAEGTNASPYNAYAKATEFTRDGIAWSVMANTFQTPWRFGGKSITNEDREAFTKTAMSDTISKVEVTTKDIFNGCTFNGIKLVVSKQANFSVVVEQVTATPKDNSVIVFEATKDWTDCYFDIVFNITVSGSENKCVQVSAIEFFGHHNY